jgi:hypothetical protein
MTPEGSFLHQLRVVQAELIHGRRLVEHPQLPGLLILQQLAQLRAVVLNAVDPRIDAPSFILSASNGRNRSDKKEGRTAVARTFCSKLPVSRVLSNANRTSHSALSNIAQSGIPPSGRLGIQRSPDRCNPIVPHEVSPCLSKAWSIEMSLLIA